MNNIENIILSVLEDLAADLGVGAHAIRVEVAQKVAQALTLASLEQLAALMGTNLSYDCDGQALIFTGVYDENKADAEHDFKAEQGQWRDQLLKTLFNNFASDDIHPTEVP